MEGLKEKLDQIWNRIDDAMWELSEARQEIDTMQDNMIENNNSIKDLDNFKRELKRDGLYSEKLEEFLEDYMKYYNKWEEWK